MKGCFVYEDFEESSAGGGRMGDAPDRGTPRGRRRFADDRDDRLFRQVTDDEQSQRARSDRGGSAVASDQDENDFINFAMNIDRRPRTGFSPGGSLGRHAPAFWSG